MITREQLRAVVAEVLEIDPSELASDTDLRTIETFDSVSVLTLIVTLDEQLGIKMDPSDAQRLKLYSDIEEIAERSGQPLVG